MTDLVVDASAAVAALYPEGRAARCLSDRLAHATTHAPHLVDAEVGNVLRGKVRTGQLADHVATTGVLAMCRLVNHRYPHTGGLAAEAWRLRHNITFYDALYVALAARLDLPLLTADAKLANAPTVPCEVELLE